ncbi:hypothetical protein R4K55_11755 [Brachyspira alvinipulli]|uniref:hypothetical protein n=1 Tax=Brachyspira alvinipulli TaxID=84379 RepID=UPI002637FAAB|nr:hypothetical protein [uncultured Brachyspira sp.]
MEGKNMLYVLIGAIVVAGGGFVLYKLSKASANSLINKAVYKDLVTMEELIRFFKNDDVLQHLKENENLIAVAIKSKLDDGNIHILAALFNNNTKEVEYYEKYMLNYKTSKLDEDLNKAFEDKDMIVLK